MVPESNPCGLIPGPGCKIDLREQEIQIVVSVHPELKITLDEPVFHLGIFSFLHRHIG